MTIDEREVNRKLRILNHAANKALGSYIKKAA